MKRADRIAGFLMLGVGLATAAYAVTFPGIAGQRIGPGFFPAILGAGLAILGAALIASGGRPRAEAPLPVEPRAKRPAAAGRFALVVAALLFYALAVDWLGFFLTAFLLLSVLMLAFGVPRSWIAPLAALVTLVIHYGFYTLLRVPLPWGILQPLAW